MVVSKEEGRGLVCRVLVNLFRICVLLTTTISVSHASGEFNSSQQQQQQYKQLSGSSGSSPVVRNVDIASPSTFGNRYVGGGKYRSSYYYPKSSSSYVIANPTTTQSPSPPTGGGGGGRNPVWVVWSRQGTPYEGGYSSPSSSDYYQYQLDNNHNDKYYSNNNYLYDEDDDGPSNDSEEPNFSGNSKSNWVRTVDSDEDDQNNSAELDRLSLAQLKGLKGLMKTSKTKTRRTGGAEILGGILSLKGLKLGAIGMFYLFRGVVILLWKFLPWIFLAMVALLFVPVPIITIPASAGAGSIGGRGNMVDVFNVTDLTNSAYSILGRVADSEQCIERISCEIRRQSRQTWFHSTIKMFIYQYESQLPQSIQRMAKAFVQHKRCKYYHCFLFDNPTKKKMESNSKETSSSS